MRGLMLGVAVMACAAAQPVAARSVKVEEVSIDQLQTMMSNGRASSVDITRAYLARIAAMDRRGPTLRSVIAINHDALAQARALDAERRGGRVRGPLHGIPILIKDNIETADRMAIGAFMLWKVFAASIAVPPTKVCANAGLKPPTPRRGARLP